MTNTNTNTNIHTTTAPVGRKRSLLELACDGIAKADIDAVLKDSWEIFPILHEILGITRYYTKSWQGKYLYGQLHDGTILVPEDNHTRYSVVYQGCTAMEVSHAPQVRVSFRASLYGNYVLVQIPFKDSIPKGVITPHE